MTEKQLIEELEELLGSWNDQRHEYVMEGSRVMARMQRGLRDIINKHKNDTGRLTHSDVENFTAKVRRLLNETKGA